MIELLKHYGGKHLVGKDVDDIIRGSFERAEMIVKYRKKQMAKMQSLKHSQTSKMIKRKFKNITTDVTVVKLLRKEEEFQRIQDRILTDFGIKREVSFHSLNYCFYFKTIFTIFIRTLRAGSIFTQ